MTTYRSEKKKKIILVLEFFFLFIKTFLGRSRLDTQKLKKIQGLHLSERMPFIGIIRSKLRALLKPSEHRSTMVTKGLRGFLNWTPSCREQLVSRIADVFFSVYTHKSEYRNFRRIL